MRTPANSPDIRSYHLIFLFYEPEINYGEVKRGRKTTNICGLLFPENAEVAKSELEKLAMDRLLWKKDVAEWCKSLNSGNKK
ncbi:hypothetical protein BpHYR1_018222 [Brachionus plicatilis]|uniref:Uncharacterized protein n=1 Tax=Brachionus plicatilis TaxID=10195 RepID=A0A3M7Q3J3_BRAPC|nr:hypothetical protein BpHYR1_018222 [Brachionus plicatilis]